MTLGVTVVDPATGKEAVLTEENHLIVTQYTCPPLLSQRCRVFRQFLTDDGLASGTSSMLIGAAAAPTEFWVQACCDADRYITTLSFVIADDGCDLDEFGAIAALANGCELFYETYLGEVIIDDELQANWDFVRACLGEPSFGTGVDAFRARNIEGKVDAYIPILDFRRYIPPHGIKLDMGTRQRLVLRVNDRTDQIDAFNARAYGFDRFE